MIVQVYVRTTTKSPNETFIRTYPRRYATHIRIIPPISVLFHQRSLRLHLRCCSYQVDKRAKPGNLLRSNSLSVIG